MDKKKTSMKLFASILLNVFLMGVVFSCFVMKPDRPPHGPQHRVGPIIQFEKAKKNLSPDSQAVIDEILKEQSEILQDNIEAIQHVRREAEHILLAPTLDKDALEKAHNDIDVNSAAMKASLSDIIYQIAIELPDADRVLFFKKALPKPPHKRDSNKRPPPRH